MPACLCPAACDTAPRIAAPAALQPALSVSGGQPLDAAAAAAAPPGFDRGLIVFSCIILK
jgi:hypothetical protein